MKILITGGAGYLGSILTEKLLYANLEKQFHTSDTHALKINELIIYDNLKYKQTSLISNCYKKNFTFVHADVQDKKTLLRYINKADVIIPLAAIVGFPACEINKELATAVNYEQIKFILDNTSKEQVIIYPNTNSGYGIGTDGVCTESTPLLPVSHYGKTKCDAENLLLDSGRALTLRLATVFGLSPRMRLDLLVNDFTYRAVRDNFIVLFEQHAKRNYIHIRDVALTFIFMINNYSKYIGQAFNVGLDSANLTKLELCEEIKKFIPSFVIKNDEYTKDPDKRNYIVSNQKLLNTGWIPYYTIQDGIEELIKGYKLILNNINSNYTNL